MLTVVLTDNVLIGIGVQEVNHALLIQHLLTLVLLALCSRGVLTLKDPHLLLTLHTGLVRRLLLFVVLVSLQGLSTDSCTDSRA